jgi:hypothetical protein
MQRLRPATLAAALVFPFVALVGAIQAWAYWPGIMTWDAVRQYDQAANGGFDDWHPPAMGWLWQKLIPIHVGPMPMLVLQLALYWIGFALMVWAAWRRERRGCAVALALCALLPIPLALMGSVLKDCLMLGALLVATAMLALARPGRSHVRWDWVLRVIGILFLIAAATLRFNAFVATVPLMVALLPAGWRDRWWRIGIATIVAAGLSLGAMPVANRLIGAEKSGVELSLVIFDLGGITKHTGIDAFPPIGVANPVAVNRRCYTALKWDSYSFWAANPCPISFEKVEGWFGDNGGNPYLYLLRAIVAHPIAYAHHRLAHFNLNSRFLVRDVIDKVVPNEPAPSPGNFQITQNPALHAIDRVAVLSAETPLGWPIWWMAMAFGCLVLSPMLPTRGLILPVALSALLYGLAYLGVSVAPELRYHNWTMVGTALALVLVVDDLVGGAAVSRRPLLLALAPAAIVTLICIAWRLG